MGAGGGATKIVDFGFEDAIAVGTGLQGQVEVYTQGDLNNGRLWGINTQAKTKTADASGPPLASNGAPGTANGGDVVFSKDGTMHVSNPGPLNGLDGIVTNIGNPPTWVDPGGMAVESSGKLLVMDNGSDILYRVDPLSGVQTEVSGQQVGSQFQIPVTVGVDRCPFGCSVSPPVVPAPAVGGSKKQKLGKSGALKVSVTCAKACTATVAGTLNVGGGKKASAAKTYKIKPVKKTLAANKRTTITLKLSKKARSAAKKALKKHKKVSAALTVSVPGAKTASFTVKLRK